MNAPVPKFTVLVGLPASGKSTWAEKKAAESNNTEVFSSDALRKELYGDESTQGDPNFIFTTLKGRIKKCLLAGKNAILDATNVSRKNRVSFMQEFKNIPCEKNCVVFIVPVRTLIERNSNRKRVVPEMVINRMLLQYCPPHKGEGFDNICYKFDEACEWFTDDNVISLMRGFDQKNSHHTLDLLSHCEKARDIVVEVVGSDDEVLSTAALFHDCGKVYTQTAVNAKGIDDGNYHYYSHQNVSAYIASMVAHNMGYNDEKISRLCNIIYLHMCPYLDWKNSEKALNKSLQIVGQSIVSDVYVLHTADEEAH